MKNQLSFFFEHAFHLSGIFLPKMFIFNHLLYLADGKITEFSSVAF
jgi:hypothetical protein